MKIFHINYFSEFIPRCLELTQLVQSKLGQTAKDIGIAIRGATVTSNFCPTCPVVHSFILYVQNSTGDDFDNFNTHDS